MLDYTMAAAIFRATVQENPLETALSTDRIQILDNDDFSKQINDATKIEVYLQSQIEDIKIKIESCLKLLSSDNSEKLENCFMGTEIDNYTLSESSTLEKCSQLQNIVSVHKLLGLECTSLTKNRFIFIIHSYEDNYPSLPPKIFKIEQIENSVFYKMKPKEISYHLKCDEQSKSMMIKSTRSDMVECFRVTQGLIFDIVLYNNVFQKLMDIVIVNHSLSCQRTMEGISLIISIDWQRDENSKILFNSLNSTLKNNVTIMLQAPTIESNYMWAPVIYQHGDVNIRLPDNVGSHMKTFMSNFKDKPVVECVKLLVEQYQLRRLSISPSTSSDRDRLTDDFNMF